MSRQSLMQKYADLEARRDAGEGGFTLIELLVVVVIIGILVAIAIPLYLHFENGAKTGSAEADVHGLTNLVKLCESDNSSVLPASATQATPGGVFAFAETPCVDDKYRLSNGNTAIYVVGHYAAPGTGAIPPSNVSGTGTDYEIRVTNSASGKVAVYESATGQTYLY